MSIVKTAGKMAVGVGVGFTVIAGAIAGAAVLTAANPNVRRRVAKTALKACDMLLMRAGRAIEAGREAAQARQRELERLLEGGAENAEEAPQGGAG